jgi:hypothetical protein
VKIFNTEGTLRLRSGQAGEHRVRQNLCDRPLLRFDYFAAANAGRADAHALGSGAHAGVHRAEIDVPAPLGDVVGVADAVS